MRPMTFNEYKIIEGKLTKNQRAFYEKENGYGTKLREETLQAELDAHKAHMKEIKERILGQRK